VDREAIDLLKEHEVFVVMDLLAAHYDLIEKNLDFSDKELGHGNEEEYAQYRKRFQEAYQAGVRIAFGTDAGVYPHGRNGEQFQLMVDAGMTPLDALRSATLWAAELSGIEKEAGTLEVGKRADLIAVEGDPLEDVSVLEDVRFVMKGGVVYQEKTASR
jgi:imidazolonepropionase-like amidohydrolase